MNALTGAAERRSLRLGNKLADHLSTGLRGERAAYFWLCRRGYVIVARAWRSGRAPGDLDLIAWHADTLCFVEVKTRSTRAVAPAHLAVDPRKRRVLRRLARHYMRQLPRRDMPTRFDILSVYLEEGLDPNFEHFPNAFGWAEAER